MQFTRIASAMTAPFSPSPRDSPTVRLLLVLLTLVAALVSNLYGLFFGISIVIPHLFYIPIILAAFFYPRRGLAFSGIVSVAYLLMVAVIHPGYTPDVLSASVRCIVFVVIAAVVSYLSEQVSAREIELRRAKDDWERTFDAVPDLVALIDRDHRILRVNKAMADHLGMSKEKAVGMKCFEIVHHASYPPLHCPHAMLLKDGNSHTEEIHEDNLGGDFLVTASPLLNEEGTLIGSIHSARDITKRMQIEKALHENENVLHQKSLVLALKVRELNCLYETARLVETSETTDALLQSVTDILPSAWPYPDSTCARLVLGNREFRSTAFRECRRVQDARIMVHGNVAGRIEIFFTGDDESRPFPNGETDLLSAIAERIGRVLERKEMEEALREKTEELNQYFSTSLDLFCIADTQGYFRRLNPEWEKTLGYTLGDLEGKRFLDFVHPDDLQNTLNAIADLRSQKEVLNFTNRYRHKDRTYRWIEWRSFPKGDRIFAAARDITYRKQAAQAVLQANKKLNILSSITRHDILNQITALYAYLDISRELSTNAEQRQHVDKEIETLQALQRQVEFTRYYQDIGVEEPKWHDVEDVFRRAVSQLSLEGITIDVSSEGLQVYADPLIEKVFFNLVENSIRHGEHVTEIRVRTEKSEEGYTILYEDNGAGVPAEMKTRLFQKGFGKHTGLGLFLSREILAITSITIVENGEPKKGARFEIIVPNGGYRTPTIP